MVHTIDPSNSASLTYPVANWWSGYWHHGAPSEVGFLVFTSVWTLLALLYLGLAPMFFAAAAHKFGILAAEALTMLFWFAGFIAMAVWLTDRLCYGSICNAAKAATVFAAFEWSVETDMAEFLRMIAE